MESSGCLRFIVFAKLATAGTVWPLKPKLKYLKNCRKDVHVTLRVTYNHFGDPLKIPLHTSIKAHIKNV